jgi:hypothetical protein
MTGERIEEIRRLISENPSLTRTQISERLCALWEWQSPAGVAKSISCRDVLRALDAAGKISLPPPKTAARKHGEAKPPPRFDHDTSPIECALADLRPLRVEIADKGEALAEVKSLIANYHYLGYSRNVGENIKYIIRSASGATVACLLFGSAAWSCRDRDAYIGWGKERRAEALHLLTNNVRFLIPQWVSVRCLASSALSLVAKRISRDWEAKYGHPILVLETFVESPSRFKGTAYQAANWQMVGRTAGRGRDGGHHEAILPQKDIYIYPLDRHYVKRLRGDTPLRGETSAAACGRLPAERLGGRQ